MFLGCKASALALTLLVAPLFSQGNPDYLALGDSIPFGFDPTLLFQPTLPTPNQFVGYPEIINSLAGRIRNQVNAACPGETAASFIDVTAPDNGCNSPHYDPILGLLPPFKPTIGLKAPYTGAQLDFALQFLRNNRNLKLVTLSLGGNELSLLQLECGQTSTTPTEFATCVQGKIGGVLGAYAVKLGQILAAIRTQGRYNGPLMLVKYPTPSADPLFAGAIVALNTVMEQVGSQYGAEFADAFKTFVVASLPFQGDPCKAGLFIRLSATTCDVHPSRYGQTLIAATVLASIK